MQKTTVEHFIVDMLRRIENQTERNDYVQTSNSVTLKMRNRDYGQDDNFGCFNPENFAWTPIHNPSYYYMNIIKGTVRANTAAMVSANVTLETEPRFVRDSDSGMAADLGRAILQIKEEEQWTAKLEEQICSEPQLAPGVFLKVRWDKEKKSKLKSSLQDWVQEDFSFGGKAVCPDCGYDMDSVGEMDSEVPCEHCDEGVARVTEEPKTELLDIIANSQDIKPGNSDTAIIPSAEILIDENAVAGDISKARWMVHRYLSNEYDKGSETWSFPLRWQYALKTGQDAPIRKSDDVDEASEVKKLYLTPEMYRKVELNQPFKLGDFEAKTTLSKSTYKGKPLEDAVLCFKTHGTKLMEVYPSDFREEFIYISFLTNPASFWGLYLTEMLSLQDIINYMLTIWVLHTRRNARSSMVLNRNYFEGEDVEKDIIFTNDSMPPDVAIQDTFGIVPALPFSQEPMNLIQTILSVKSDIGGVAPAMTGGDASEQGYTTFSGQLLAKNQSMAQLAPFSRSKAGAKVQWAKTQLKLAQKHWTEEDFMFLLKLNGEWDETYVEAFLNCNLDTDIIINYRAGSEMPTSLIEREIQLRQFIGDLTTLAQLDPTIIKPELIADILSHLKTFGNIDIDVNNGEGEMKLADTRYDRIVDMIGKIGEVPEEMMDVVIQQIVSMPDMIPYMHEDHAAHIAFYTDKIRQENCKDKPSRVLVKAFDAMINIHTQAGIGLMQQQTADQMAIQAPAMEAEQQQMQEQAMQEQAMMQGQAEQERSAKIEDAEMEEKSKDKDFQRNLAQSVVAAELAKETQTSKSAE